ncbi:nucleotidyltransferase substrate binding protein [Candidatus Parcubacteria bacterium]|nr:nucleotidyltransferase substrate binding protein [Patescibacteria group bacterium]MBU4481936.1 nucleotidyltransferase substrate binding protein [Patescibacteria group bacterium]MCG2687098.1 nucleotidyltransferase substrate binding protein [Candidatus Parcubacteria bacterium]
MDKTLNYKLKDFEKAIQTLKESLEIEQNDFIKDAVIKRFEYSFELCWKTTKAFLSQKFGIDIYSPKECFRELRRNKLLNDDETEALLKMTNDRNEIIHTYNENFADELYKKITNKYYKSIEKVFEVVSE